MRGAVLDEERIQQVETGKMTEQQVYQLLGSPSTTATFPQRSRVWYYISRETETTAFLAPKLLDQRVVAIEFDEGGRVKDLRRYSMADGKDIELVDRETPSRGRELGLLEQLFGNIGRFTEQNTPQR